MPNIVLRIITPEIVQIFRLLRGVLKSTKQDHIILPRRQTMSTSSRWTLPFYFHPGPFSVRRIEFPEIIVMIECALLWRRKFTSKQVHVCSVCGCTPSMTTSWKRTIWASDNFPSTGRCDQFTKLQRNGQECKRKGHFFI